MNRIYQGRVTKVQKLKPDCKGMKPEDWEDMDDGEDALWRHHEVFQDAVNYYTLALVALGEALPDSHPFRKLRERMQEGWEVFPKRTPTPARSAWCCDVWARNHREL